MRLAVAAACLAALCWACAPPPIQGPPTPTLVLATRVPVTFPPTWTPTFTSTPPPPSPTNTPSPTVPPTATLGRGNIERLCETFQFNHAFDRGETFEHDEKIAFSVEVQRADVVVRFLAVHRLTGENQGIQVPGGQVVLAELPVSLLPLPGLYDWTASVHHDELGDFCTQEGYFFVRDAPPGEAMEEATVEVEATEEPAP